MNSLQINYAVIFDLLAVFVHFLHDSARLLAIFKLNDHLLRHKVDGSGFDTGGLVGGILHQIGRAACSILLAQLAQSTSIL